MTSTVVNKYIIYLLLGVIILNLIDYVCIYVKQDKNPSCLSQQISLLQQ